MAASYWACRHCGTRMAKTKRKCTCGQPRPRKAVRSHMRALDKPYEQYNELNKLIHGKADESCGACGKPRSQERRHDRDHGHRSGNPRGLLCGGNQGCNILLLPWVTAATAKGIAQAKEVAGEKDSERWWMLAGYLERCEDWYLDHEDAA